MTQVADHDQFTRYNPEQDDINTYSITDKRKPHLTLAMLNKLKKIRETKKLEMLKARRLASVMYGQSGGEE